MGIQGYNNPPVGADGVIARAQYRSENFVPGASGWSIKKDGTAEFQTAVLRGSVSVGTPGNPQISIYTLSGAAVIDLPTGDTSEITPSRIIARMVGVDEITVISSARLTGAITANREAGIWLQSQANNGTTREKVVIGSVVDTGPGAGITSWASMEPTLIQLGSNLTQVTNSFQVDQDSKFNGIITGPKIAGFALLSFTALTSFTQAVVFPAAFATVPVVVTNINNGSASAAHWSSRAISITTTGFTLFVYAEAAGAAQTWVSVSVQWIAIGS